MPDDWLIANSDHGLWNVLGDIANTRAEAAAQDYHFHRVTNKRR